MTSREARLAAPKVSVLIHNLERASSLRRCLSSVSRQRYRPLEVLLFDAGSSDGSTGVMREWVRRMKDSGIEARWSTCPPMGVPSSRNYMAARAAGDLLFMMDNDAVLVGDRAIAAAVSEFEADERLALVSFRILDGERVAVDPRAWVFRRPSARWADRRFETFTFAGTGFCVRAAAFRAAGGFWDAFRYAREEEDLAFALLDLDWRILYSPRITLRHFADSTGRVALAERRAMELRNGAMVLVRRLPFPLAAAAVPLRVLSMSVRAMARDGLGVRSLWGSVPGMLRRIVTTGVERRPVRMRTVTRYLALHRPHGSSPVGPLDVPHGDGRRSTTRLPRANPDRSP